MAQRPTVAMVADTRVLGPHQFDVVGRKYIKAISELSEATVILLPATPGAVSIEAALALADGLLFTGSTANVHPDLYGSDEPPVLPDKLDPDRDALTLPLLRAAIEVGKPIFCICRGFQELNVALGGTLYQAIQNEPGRMDHREDLTTPLDVQYSAVHPLKLSGWFAKTIGTDNIMVNSLHGQGIRDLAPRLVAEAIAPDGIIEGVRLKDGPGFCVGTQWHPEWQASGNPASTALFKAFGDVIRG